MANKGRSKAQACFQLPPEMVERIKRKALSDRRSVSMTAQILLERALGDEAAPAAPDMTDAERLRRVIDNTRRKIKRATDPTIRARLEAELERLLQQRATAR